YRRSANMGRSLLVMTSGLKKGPWTPEEDEKLVNYVQKHGHSSWRELFLSLLVLTGVGGKSCRLRWTNYLRPDIKRGKISPDEETNYLEPSAVLGNKWSTIANHLPGDENRQRDQELLEHSSEEEKLIQMGIDPMTHLPRTDIFSSLSQLMSLSSN
ncbi:hypothetical protein HID58_094932, partial [Brassica napus]